MSVTRNFSYGVMHSRSTIQLCKLPQKSIESMMGLLDAFLRFVEKI